MPTFPLVGLSDWANFGLFWVNFSKISADFFLGNILFFLAKKNKKLIISGHIFTIGQPWFFKSLH